MKELPFAEALVENSEWEYEGIQGYKRSLPRKSIPLSNNPEGYFSLPSFLLMQGEGKTLKLRGRIRAQAPKLWSFGVCYFLTTFTFPSLCFHSSLAFPAADPRADFPAKNTPLRCFPARLPRCPKAVIPGFGAPWCVWEHKVWNRGWAVSDSQQELEWCSWIQCLIPLGTPGGLYSTQVGAAPKAFSWTLVCPLPRDSHTAARAVIFLSMFSQLCPKPAQFHVSAWSSETSRNLIWNSQHFCFPESDKGLQYLWRYPSFLPTLCSPGLSPGCFIVNCKPLLAGNRSSHH